jgi:pseudouridine synthase
MRILKYWKPVGAVTSLSPSEPFSILKFGRLREEHLKLIQQSTPPMIPVGRLDKDSSGLLLMTDDPGLVLALTKTYNSLVSREGLDEEQKNASYGSKYQKVYHVTTEHFVSDHLLSRLRCGVSITTRGRRVGAEKSKKKTLPCLIERSLNPVGGPTSMGRSLDLYITLREGRNRQIRKMIGSVGHSVVTLCRLSFGPVTMSGLSGPGDLQPLTPEEIESLDQSPSGEIACRADRVG